MGVKRVERKKKLEVLESPLKGYMEDAYPLTVAITKASSYEWIYSNYIQLMFQDPQRFDNQPIKYYKLSWNSGLIWDADCPLLKYDTVPRQILESNGIDIVDYITNAISQEYYVKVYLDEYFLPFRPSYQKKHYLHESLFIGYDLDRRILYGLAYVTDYMGYHFKEFFVNMEDVREAYRMPVNDSVQRSRVMLMSCNWEKFYEFDIDSVKESIYEYINSIPTEKKYASITNTRNYFFGISVYDKLAEKFENIKSFKGVIPFHIIMEHKQLMVQRIRYMLDNRFINRCDDILLGFENLVEETQSCKMLFIKYLYAPTNKNRDKVKGKIIDIKEHDEEMMKKLYAVLEDRKKEKKESLSSRWGLWKDIAYDIGKNLQGKFNISFHLHIICNEPRGYIRFSNHKKVYDFCAPIVLWIDATKHQFKVGNEKVLEGISCTSNSSYRVEFTIDLVRKEYSLFICNEKEAGYLKNIDYEEDIDFIDQIIIIHDNAYYYSVDGVNCS